MKRFLTISVCIMLVFGLLQNSALAAAADPLLLETPYNLTVSQMVVDTEHPFGGVILNYKIDNMPSSAAVTENATYYLNFEKKINDEPWNVSSFNKTDAFQMQAPNSYTETYTWGEDYSKNVLAFRVRMIIYDNNVISKASAWSNIATFGLEASTWAVPEIEKSIGSGLVSEAINGDFTRPITREEFAELAVRLYEVNTGQKASPAASDTFSDCEAVEVLKAYALGIVNGKGQGIFDPQALTTREEIAAMVYRAVEAIAPDTDMSTTDAPTFIDQVNIAPWFLENVRFMSKKEFIKGSNGYFNPKDTCTREMAVLIAVRVYEDYLVA